MGFVMDEQEKPTEESGPDAPDSWDLLTEPLPGLQTVVDEAASNVGMGHAPPHLVSGLQLAVDDGARRLIEETERELAEIFSGVELDGSGQAPESTAGAALPAVRLSDSDIPPPLPPEAFPGLPRGVEIREATDAEQLDAVLRRARELRLAMFAQAERDFVKLLSRRPRCYRDNTGPIWWAHDVQKARTRKLHRTILQVGWVLLMCVAAIAVGYVRG